MTTIAFTQKTGFKKAKEEFSRRFNGTISSLKNLSFLRNLDYWRKTIEQGERSTASRLVPFITASGSVIYRKPASTTTTTQAQPKKTIPKPTANLQTAGPLNWLKDRKQRKIETKEAEQKRKFLEYETAKTEAQKAEIKAKEIAKKKAESKTRILDAKNKQVNIILNKVVDNFPLENPSQRYLNLGSGYHDGASYYAVDLNSMSGGDHDRGDSVLSVSKGTIIIGSEVISNGALRIQHTGNTDGKDFTWQSNYLHLPIFDTGKSETVDVLVNGVMKKEERKIYEVRKQVTTYDEKGKSVEIITTDKSDEMIKIWTDKVVQSGEQIGYVGGRMADNDTIDNAHLHFSATLDSMTVDLRTTLESAGLKTFKAFDGYGTSRFVKWNEALQVWVNDSDKLILDRRAQKTLVKGPTPYQSWRAWEDGRPVGEMKKVVNQKIGTDKVTKKEVYAWTHTNSDGIVSVWNNDINGTFQFTDLEKYKLTLAVE